MSNDVTIVYNFPWEELPQASAEELKSAVRFLRARDNFSVSRWMTSASDGEVSALVADLDAAMLKLAEQWRKDPPTWEHRQLAGRIREAKSIRELSYTDLVSVLAEPDLAAHWRIEHRRAMAKWLEPFIQKTMDEQARVRATVEAQARDEMVAEVTAEVNAMLLKAADDNAATAD